LVTTDGRNFAFVFDKHTTGGKGLPRAMGADIVGTFIALVYLTPFIGGLLQTGILVISDLFFLAAH
jgi:POT family proton-dependent oligopeptide transporter